MCIIQDDILIIIQIEMSVRLPNINKSQSEENQLSVKKSPSSKSIAPQFSSPVEDVVMLKKQMYGVLKTEIKNDSEDLQVHFDKNNELIEKLKNSINGKKQTLRSIGEEVDRNLNKSLFKSAKGNSVNIRDIFSAPPKSDNDHVNKMNEELRLVRYQIKKVKMELSMNASNPIVDSNQERGKEYYVKLKQYQNNIKELEREKGILSDEIHRGQKECGLDQQREKEEQCKRMIEQFNQVSLLERQKKQQMYKLEKQDIYLVEKIKFLAEKHKEEPKKRKNSLDQIQKRQIQKEITELIANINEIISERNKIEIEKKNTLRNLQTQANEIKMKNQILFAKLRSNQAFLLQFYENKTRRNHSSKKQQIVPIEPKKRIKIDSTKANKTIDTQKEYKNVTNSPTKHIKKQSVYDDKNIQDMVVELNEKKKTLDFGSIERISASDIILSDQIYGVKNKLSKLTLFTSSSQLLGMQATYLTPQGKIIPGYKMIQQSLIESSQKIELTMNSNEVLSFVHIGVDKGNHIKYLHFMTKERQVKWGDTKNIAKQQQKNIQNYQSIHFKAKLIKENSMYVIGAIALSIIYLSSN